MTNEEKRKAKNKFISDLTELLTDEVEDDDYFFEKLLWANSFIANELTYFIKER